MRKKIDTAEAAIERNISAVHDLRIKSDESRRLDQKFVDQVAAFAGSTNSIYAHLLFYGSWVLFGLIGGHSMSESFGATKTNLSLAASLESIFLAVFVLINQRRMNSISRRHADLHLQMSMLMEHEITKIAQTTDAIAKNVGVENKARKDLDTVKKDIHPQEIVDRLSDLEARSPTSSTNDPDRDRQS